MTEAKTSRKRIASSTRNDEHTQVQGKQQRRHRASPDGLAPYAPIRGAFSGKGKQKRSPVSTLSQSHRRSGRARKTSARIGV